MAQATLAMRMAAGETADALPFPRSGDMATLAQWAPRRARALSRAGTFANAHHGLAELWLTGAITVAHVDARPTVRLANAAQRRALAVRDGGCVVPGCEVRASSCQTQTHHIAPWESGGSSDLSNLALLCWSHHRQVDLGRWEISPASDNDRPTLTIRPRAPPPAAGSAQPKRGSGFSNLFCHIPWSSVVMSLTSRTGRT